MPRKKPVEIDELKAFVERAREFGQEAHDLTSRFEGTFAQGQTDGFAEAALGLLSASRALSDLVHQILVRLALDEQRAADEAELRKQIAASHLTQE